MVDFNRLRQDFEASLTEEQRELIRCREAADAAAEETAVDIEAQFEGLAALSLPPPVRRMTGFGQRPLPPKPPAAPRRWTATIRMRIEKRPPPSPGEVLRFIGGVTGHEAYALDETFGRVLAEAEGADGPEGRWFICGGTRGRYDSCSVRTSDIAAYVRALRPALMPSVAAEPPSAASAP